MTPDLPNELRCFQGALVGTTCGDALGLPVEGPQRPQSVTITDVVHDRMRHRARDLAACAAEAWQRHRP
jgi:ADP-ribosylglycohydrolase